MPLLTKMQCDCKCGKVYELDEEPRPEVRLMLQLTDSMGQKYFFASILCLKKFLETYQCPYITQEETAALESMLPGEDDGPIYNELN